MLCFQNNFSFKNICTYKILIFQVIINKNNNNTNNVPTYIYLLKLIDSSFSFIKIMAIIKQHDRWSGV